MPLNLDYYYGNEAEQYSFYRIPKILFTNDRFKAVSVEAKVLYGLLLDRMALSIKNSWLDEDACVFIIYTISDVMETLCCAEQKANKLLGELDSNTTLVGNIRAYTMSALFNAPVTISQYYSSFVSHDMAQGFGGS